MKDRRGGKRTPGEAPMYKRALSHSKNTRTGFKDRPDVERGWVGELKIALRLWELRQLYPHLRP
jgi:hypothetical protein